MDPTPSCLATPVGLWLERAAFAAGAVGFVLSISAFWFDAEPFFRCYLVAFQYCLAIALGSLAILMLQHLTGGAWATLLKPVLESATGTLPVLAGLTIPLGIGLGHLYPWARPDEVEADMALQHKRPYLNVPFFAARAAVYFICWIGLACWLAHFSRAQRRNADPRFDRAQRLLSAPGLLVLGITVTFSAIDWVQSLDPHWFSTIFGVLIGIGQLLGAFAFAVLSRLLIMRRQYLKGWATATEMGDLGNLLLAFIMVWGYVSFSQFLIIWSGNLPEEVTWYLRRLEGGWQGVALLLIVFQFFAPFLLLLSRDLKRSISGLIGTAGIVLVMRYLELAWLILPGESATSWHVLWIAPASMLAVGGLWVATLMHGLRKQGLEGNGNDDRRTGQSASCSA